MLVTQRISLPVTASGTALIKSLKDALNEARAARNIYPPIGNFCKYLLIHQIDGSGLVSITATPAATIDEVGQGITTDGLIFEDMSNGSIPLSEIYLYVQNETAGPVTLGITLMQ